MQDKKYILKYSQIPGRKTLYFVDFSGLRSAKWSESSNDASGMSKEDAVMAMDIANKSYKTFEINVNLEIEETNVYKKYMIAVINMKGDKRYYTSVKDNGYPEFCLDRILATRIECERSDSVLKDINAGLQWFGRKMPEKDRLVAFLEES